MNYWALFFILLGVFAGWLEHRSKEVKFQNRLAGRASLTDAEFGQKFFPADHAEIAARLRSILSHHYDEDVVRLHPNDRFVEDLLMDDMDSMSTVEFIIEIEDSFGIKIPDSEAERLITFQALVDSVAEKVNAKNKSC